MYAKLVFRNAKRSVKDYLVYIVTMTICVTLFYAFLSISSSYYSPDIGSEYDFTLLSDGMKIAICMITLLLLFLIRFVNHYMLRRKQKEFAVQSIMGMEQKTIGRIFFAETLIMGMFSILIGIFCGVFCSQFITAMLLTAYGKPYEISWTLFPDTVLLTGNVKKCAVGKHPKSEKLGGIGSGCRLRLRPLPVLRRRQSQRVARIDPNAVVVDKNIAENDRFDLFSR